MEWKVDILGMETIPPQESNPANEHQPGQNNPEKMFDGTSRPFENFTSLEIAALIVIIILLFNQLFAFSITVRRKPLLEKILGRTTTLLAPSLAEQVMPPGGVGLPAAWNDLGKQMVLSGVIDQQKFETLYVERGGLGADMKKMLLESGNGKVKITAENSAILLNMLWALGLGNKNEILDKGEMWDKQYGGDAGKFASTGGWTLAAGNVMDHYSKHHFLTLTPEQQAMVEKASKNIYRPCCNNSANFPDCNHGMAMLGLLELMASQGVSEQEMYKAALAVNSYWFPNNYLTLASYFKEQGIDWARVNPQVVLSAQYSSAQGYQELLRQITPAPAPKNSGGCGV